MGFIKAIMKKIWFMQNIPKILYVNFVALPFKQARHLPIYCGRRTTLVGLRRGAIVLEGKVARGVVNIGLDSIRGGGLGGKKYKNTYLQFGEKSKIIFRGKGSFASGNTVLLGQGAELILGEDFSTNVLCSFYVYDRITFGDDCFCGWNVSVRDGDGHYIIEKDTGRILNHPREIVVGSHVWLCSDVTVLKGVTIADDSVVACNSLVTKSLVQPHTIYGGNPAKILKSGISFIRDGHGYGCGGM